MNQTDLNSIPNDKIDHNQIDAITDALMDLQYEQILAKYNKNDFFNSAFNDGPLNQITLLRDLMVEDFLPGEKLELISNANKDNVIEILAGIKNDTDITYIEKWLKDVNPKLTIPKNFDKTDYQQRAYKIWNGMQNLKTVIAEESASIYTSDVNFLLKVPVEQFSKYQTELKDISGKIKIEYQKLIDTGNFNRNVLPEAIAFISQCGRTPTFITSLQDNQNLGMITEIILKIDRAISIVDSLHLENITNPDPTTISDKIQDYLIKEIHF